jgi:hypothetical protein
MRAKKLKRPNVELVLSRLKQFQRDTVEYVFQRLYKDGDSQRRFLIADEVGLGKTLVAKGLLAKAIDHLWDTVEQIDVVYICSNSDIARQNITRLNITGSADFEHASRITLLPVRLDHLKPDLNFVSFTPGTSFDLKSNLGVAEERRLIYWMLRDSWGFEDRLNPKNVLQGNVRDTDWWRYYISEFSQDIDPLIQKDFERELKAFSREERKAGKPGMKERFEGLCDFFSRADRVITPEMARERNQVIGRIRQLLAKSCLRLLKPDIVIMDEFQRFKHLLSNEDEAGQLAQVLFSYSSEHSEVRTLLLSATPYKMYTLYEECEEDDHYKDFLATLSFLEDQRAGSHEALLKEYRQELFRCHRGSFGRLKEIKSQLEQGLRKVMVRKERVAVSGDQDDMLEDRSAENPPVLTPGEIDNYLGLQKIARCLDHGDMLEYWKSSSYLLNFMDGYKIKELLQQSFDGEKGIEIIGVLRKYSGILLPWRQVRRYGEIEPSNARLQQLMDETIGMGMWQLLWLPPSLSYYEISGPFAIAGGERLTKRLVFSSWNVVPKQIAAMMSYEAERRMFSLFEEQPEYSSDWRKKQGNLLKFAEKDGKPTGMSALGVLYPSFALATCGDPLKFYQASIASNQPRPSLVEIVNSVSSAIEERLKTLDISQASAAKDENWYWVAPILLDLQQDRLSTEAWWRQEGLDRIWSGGDTSENKDHESRWTDHVRKAREVLDRRVSMGARPADLSHVLALNAIGGPAVAALRSLCRIAGRESAFSDLSNQNAAARMAWGFRSLFNRPEVTCLLRGLSGKTPYWMRIIEYCAEGGLQAVLDEYVHVLKEYLGLMDEDAAKTVADVSEAVSGSLQLMTSRIEIEHFSLSGENRSSRKESMRGHFALRFGVQESEEGSEPTREDRVRQSFNSPFWPFVLASTSVGQEGLDFHPYCHAIVHWNLPNNPVDMEQREGRVHRYKGHAIRKNVAKIYADVIGGNGCRDPWEAMFSAAMDDHGERSRGMVPYWNFPVAGGARVERHVPALQFSRDQLKLAALRRSLAVYRMAFGQSRQEDLVEYLLKHLPANDTEGLSQLLQLDMAAPFIDLKEE